jgi:hypothetical protein
LFFPSTFSFFKSDVLVEVTGNDLFIEEEKKMTALPMWTSPKQLESSVIARLICFKTYEDFVHNISHVTLSVLVPNNPSTIRANIIKHCLTYPICDESKVDKDTDKKIIISYVDDRHETILLTESPDSWAALLLFVTHQTTDDNDEDNDKLSQASKLWENQIFLDVILNIDKTSIVSPLPHGFGCHCPRNNHQGHKEKEEEEDGKSKDYRNVAVDNDHHDSKLEKRIVINDNVLSAKPSTTTSSVTEQATIVSNVPVRASIVDRINNKVKR